MSYRQQLLPITVFPGCSCLQATSPCGGPQKYSSGHSVIQKAPLKHILAMHAYCSRSNLYVSIICGK